MNFYLKSRLDTALAEDSAFDDATTRCLSTLGSERKTAKIIAKNEGVFCGAFLAEPIFKDLSRHAKGKVLVQDGKPVRPGQVLMEITAPLSAILAGERTFLNLTCHLSGIATLTRKYLQAVKGSKAKILDTRKTTPLWRDLEKYAVICGGGFNHRFALSDAILVKDNHVEAVRSSGRALVDFYGKKQLSSVRKKLKFVEIEAKTLPEVHEAIACQPDVILLDNMSLVRLKKSIVLIKKSSRKILIEVSGGITLQKAKRLARLGVDRISVGALTHSAPVLDISLEVV